MSRHLPTKAEADALRARGWTVDDEGWCWPPEVGCTVGRTYREAVREQARRERAGGRP